MQKPGDESVCELGTAAGSVRIRYQVERSARLKRTQIQVKGPDLVVLRLPRRVPVKQALAFMADNADWVVTALRQAPKPVALLEYLRRKPLLSLGGEQWKVQIRSGAQGLGYFSKDDAARCVQVRLNAYLDTEAQLISLLRTLAKQHIPERVAQLSKRHRLKYHGVTVRDQRCRWGSCSCTGGLSFNWRLILLPVEIQDHVILHELAHLRYFDHSAGFHRYLEKLDPSAQQNRRELDNWSSKLIPIGRVG